MIETVVASTANYRVVRWMKFGSLRCEGAGAGVEVIIYHCQLLQEAGRRSMKEDVGRSQTRLRLCVNDLGVYSMTQ
jgi:hypothetical protein